MKGIDFSQGNIVGHINRQAVPLLLAELTNASYSIVDKVFVGRFSDEGNAAITGIGIIYPVIMIITAVIALFQTGAAPLCSIARGRKDKDKAELMLNQCALYLIVSSFIMMAFLYIFKSPLIYLFGASESTYSYANEYLSIYLYGIPFSAIALGGNSFISLQGFPKYGMVTTVVGAVTNTILDSILIYQYQMGVKGAAIATILSQVFSAIWVIFFFIMKRGRP